MITIQDAIECPFCGCDEDIGVSHTEFKSTERYHVFCDNCDACSGYSYTFEGAILKWNTRKSYDVPIEIQDFIYKTLSFLELGDINREDCRLKITNLAEIIIKKYGLDK
jgi:Lar family restriction alleviation protein